MPTIETNKKPWMPKRAKTNKSWAYDARYHTTRWRNYRKVYLKQHPLCISCLKSGKNKPSRVVDHIIPVSIDNSDLNFWNSDNHQPLCIRCNNAKK